jgi:hypothetical protein
MKKSETNFQATATVAIPLTSNEIPQTFEATPASTETEKRMLLFRLSDAAQRIREESELIRRTGFSDPAGRLLRILGEAVEEQSVALSGQHELAYDGERK